VTIDVNDPRPPYQQVADDLRRKIRADDERYRPGQRMPSIRQLAKEYGISPQTVQSALRELRAEQLVIAQQGRAFFVCDPDRPATASADAGGVATRLEAVELELRRLRGRVAALESAGE
jgi:DNA-binding GntR family transcriptional regulator